MCSEVLERRQIGMELVTRSKKISARRGQVAWRVGLQRKGIIEVELPRESEDAAIIAELAAIKHLMFEDKVFNRDVVRGDGFTLIVSKGAIKKLSQGNSSKEHLSKYGSYFSYRLKGAKVIVSATDEHLPTEDDDNALFEVIKASAATHDVIQTPAMGEVHVTKHAIDQFVERALHGKPKSPWKTVVKMLKNPKLVQIESDLTLWQRIKKQAKYGGDGTAEQWKHPDGTVEFFLVNNGEYKTLVTIFDRAP